jgi:hypothetical protein
MKRVFVPLALCALPLLTTAQDLPKASPTGKVEQIVGLTKVTIEYSRPSAKGRSIFGDLVPFDKLWRTGANQSTLITFSGPVQVEGNDVPAGTYALFTTPGKDTWIIHFNKKTDGWGTEGYEATNDQLAVKVKPESGEMTENLTFNFTEVAKDDANVELRWEKTRVKFHLHADATAQALLNIDEAMKKPDADAGTYSRAASFFLERGLKPAQALQWAQKSVQMKRRYYSTWTLAEAYAATGDMTNAMKEGQMAVELANKEGDNGAAKGYQEKMDAWQKK